MRITGARAVPGVDRTALESQTAQMAESARDPVCGMIVDPARTPHREVRAGVAYHFCGARCLERFRAEPERFLAPTSRAPAAPVAAEWTCPMHPEIVRPGPGTCPICGMALEPRTVSLDAKSNPELDDMARRGRRGGRRTAPPLPPPAPARVRREPARRRLSH